MSETLPAVPPRRPERYRPPGDSSLRDSVLAVLDALPPEQRLGFALYFAVHALDVLGGNNLLPAGKTIGLGTADAVRDLIPADVVELMRKATGK